MSNEPLKREQEDADAGVRMLASLFVVGTITIVCLWLVVVLLAWVRS